MKTYIKFIIYIYLRSFLNIFLIMLGLVFILNLLSELDFFKNLDVDTFVPLYLSMLNSGSLIFEMFPFIFLISTQFFFINFFRNNELEIFKYSGLKNTSIIKILSALTLLLGIFIIIFFYNLSSTFKNIYLDKKSIYTKDNKYLAVITENGLWIKDKIDDKILIINSNKIETNFLIETFITEFDNEFQILRNIKSKKINIKEKDWIVEDAKVFIKNNTTEKKNLKIKSNFDYEIIQGLFSNLSSLSILELFKLKENYKNKYPILIAPGPNEIEDSKNLNAKIFLNENKSINLTQLITLIKKAKFVISNDTGPAHICNHLDKKGLVLFGSHTSARKVSMGTSQFKAITVKNLKNLDVNTVLEEVKKNLD